MKKENQFLYGIVLILILFLLVHVGFVFFASQQDFPLVADDYYQKELQYQDQIDRLNRAYDSQIYIHVTVENRTVHLTYPSQFLEGDIQGTLHLFRPSDSKMDQYFPLTVNRDLTQVLSPETLASGRWILYVDWMQNGKTYSLVKNLYVE